MQQAAGPADIFADLLDRIITHDGGSGNLGQLHVRLASAPDKDALAHGWQRLGATCWPVGGRWHRGLRGLRLRLRGPTTLPFIETESCDDAARTALTRGIDSHGLHLAVGNDGVVLTWDHRLCDARGAGGILAALPSLADGQSLGEQWWDADYRWVPGLPRPARVRGPMAQQAMALLIPHRLVQLWRPLSIKQRSPANRATPIQALTTALGPSDTTAYQTRQKQASGRMAETPFLLACVAGAIESLRGVDGDILMPLTIDMRETGDPRLLANCHGYCFLRVPAGMASRDLKETATHLKKAHREWVAADGLVKLSASMSWFDKVPVRLARAQMGNHRAGVWASCVVANAGATPLPANWFGADVIGVDHAACIPGTPGIGVLFHRDARGLGFSTIVTGRVAKQCPPQRFAAALRYQLLERELS